MIITFGGNIGAGKTTIAAMLARVLDYEELYVGKIFRGMAAERGKTIDEFYRDLKDNPLLEKKIDNGVVRAMKEKDNLVVQGRIAWYLTGPSPFNVLNIGLFVDPKIGAERLAGRPENAEKNMDEVTIAAHEREENERKRYHLLYGIEDHLDPSHYDIVIDTTKQTEEETLETVLKEIRAHGG